MTEYVKTAFDLQRTAFEQTHEAITESVEVSQSASKAAVKALDAPHAIQSQGNELAKAGVHAYFDALESTLPEDVDLSEAREAADENFARVEELNEETWSAVSEALEESLDAYDAAAESYVDAVDSSFDAFLDAHENVETQVTEATEVAADAVEIDVEAE